MPWYEVDLELDLRVAEVPGDTAGHVAYLTPVFAPVGDTLFAGGCGRVFEVLRTWKDGFNA